MRFDGWDTIEGRHLVFVYGSVILIQGSYALYIAVQWLRLRLAPPDPPKKAAKPV